MTSLPVKPTLTVEQWTSRRTPTMWLDFTDVNDDPHLVVTDGLDGGQVTISEADNSFTLMALANDALPDSDPRKITAEMVNGLARANSR